MIQPIINDYESYKDRIFILNPDTGVFVSAKEWIEKADDPTRAEILAVQTPYYAIVFPKKFLKGTFNFEEAQKAVSEFEAAGLNIEYKWRSPRRNESNYIYDAYWSGMKEVLEKIGGDSFETRWWTCEKDSWSCSRYGAYYAWYFYGNGGYANVNSMINSNVALPVVLLSTSEVSN